MLENYLRSTEQIIALLVLESKFDFFAEFKSHHNEISGRLLKVPTGCKVNLGHTFFGFRFK